MLPDNPRELCKQAFVRAFGYEPPEDLNLFDLYAVSNRTSEYMAMLLPPLTHEITRSETLNAKWSLQNAFFALQDLSTEELQTETVKKAKFALHTVGCINLYGALQSYYLSAIEAIYDEHLATEFPEGTLIEWTDSPRDDRTWQGIIRYRDAIGMNPHEGPFCVLGVEHSPESYERYKQDSPFLMSHPDIKTAGEHISLENIKKAQIDGQ